jgi:GrpB-like predicted nucleotidyltransferase (UPF0157 family)
VLIVAGSSYPSARVVPFDLRWADRYRTLAAHLTRGLGGDWLVEHVGSTSVPLLPAKPVIDVAMGMPAGLGRHAAEAALASLGWTDPEAVGDHLAVFVLDNGVRRAIGHIFFADQWPTAHVRLFAQWLRAHPADRDRYAALKTGLVSAGVWGRDYTNAKSAFVLEVVNRARLASGLEGLASLDLDR